MRVLHLLDDPDHPGGIRTYVDLLVRELPGRGVESEVWRPTPRRFDADGYLSRWRSPSYRRELEHYLDRERPDLVHAHSWARRLSPLPLAAARLRGTPVVVTAHDFGAVCPRIWGVRADGSACPSWFGARCLVSLCPSRRKGLRWLPYQDLRWAKTALHRPQLRKSADLVLCPSSALEAAVRRSLRPRRTACLPNCLPGGAWGHRPPADPARLAYVGRLSPEKGVDVLLRALPAVAAVHPGVSLEIVGDGPERRSLEALAATLGMRERVRFAGALDAAGVTAAWESAGTAVLPSLWMENCPLAGIEAMAHGVPLAASRIGGLPELVGEGEAGVLVPPGEPAALAEALVGLLGDPERHRRLVAGALARFRKRHALEPHLDSLVGHYRSCIGHGNG